MTLYINGRFLTQPVSGVQRYAHELLRAFDQALIASPGVQAMFGPVTVLAPRGAVAPDWARLRFRHLRGGRGHAWEQGALFRATRDDVLVSLGNSGPLRHKRHVLALHDAHIYEIPHAFSWRYRVWHSAVRPVLARRAAALIAVSRHAAGQLAHHLNVDAARFSLVPNAADHILRQNSDPTVPDRYGLLRGGYLLAVGNHSPNKNLNALIAAHSRAGPGVPALAIAGGFTPGIAHRHLPGNARVHLLGRVPDADLRGLYQGAAGFVFPSLHEGFGIPPLEAMTLGVPVICARRAAMPEVLGDAPIWFDPLNTAAITHALDRFAAMQPCERDMRIGLGRMRATRYSWAGSARGLVDILAGVLAPRGLETPRNHFNSSGDLVSLFR